MKKLLLSLSPHIHGDNSTKKLMRSVIVALMPAFFVSVYFFGFSALMLVLVAISSCVVFEFIIQKYIMKAKVSVNDFSAVLTGLLLALNLPPSAPWWIAVTGAVVAIGIAKMSFGGLGHNLFNPALVGRVFLLISFPGIMIDWSLPSSWFHEGIDAYSGATALSVIRDGLANGLTVNQIIAQNNFSYFNMLFARIGGSVGEISALALIAGLIYMLAKKVIKPHIPLSIIITVIVFSGIFRMVDPAHYTDPLFNLLTGGILLGSIFMATDYVTSPMSSAGMVVFGVGIGIITMLIRNFGVYPEGMSFAILIMNATVPLLNRYFKPARFGKRR